MLSLNDIKYNNVKFLRVRNNPVDIVYKLIESRNPRKVKKILVSYMAFYFDLRHVIKNTVYQANLRLMQNGL